MKSNKKHLLSRIFLMKLIALYKRLLSHYGPQSWWPVTDEGETKPTYRKRKKLTENQKFEICVGAILTQNTDWKNVVKALENLNRAGMLHCGKMAGARRGKIAALVKPSGYYNQKAKKLHAFCQHIEKNYGGAVGRMLSKPLPLLRAELLSLHGIGNETADDIALYAAGKPSFVIDAYTIRFLERFYGKQRINYAEAKAFFESALPQNAGLFNEFHALLVEHGKRYCKKKPLCGECFLRQYCLFSQRK
jgi:endonuclease-3 related protein